MPYQTRALVPRIRKLTLGSGKHDLPPKEAAEARQSYKIRNSDSQFKPIIAEAKDGP